MFCHSCGKKNRKESSFCRFCGTSIGHHLDYKSSKNTFVESIQVFKKSIEKRFKKVKFVKLNKTILALTILLIVTLPVVTIYGATKIGDYFLVKSAMKEAQELQNKGDYFGALTSLDEVSDKWTFKAEKNNLENLKTKEESYVKYKNDFESALEKGRGGDIQEAKVILESIPYDFPAYDKVQKELSTIREQIESQLTNQALQARDEAAAAKNEKTKSDVAAAQANKEKIQAQVTAAAEAQAKSQANAVAAAATAAAVKAQEDAQRQVLLSFVSQMTTIYNALSTGASYYSNAISYYNSDSELVALSVFGQAKAIYQKAYSDSISLGDNFSNMPNDYITASNQLSIAAEYCLQASDAMINSIGYDLNVSSANAYASHCTSTRQSVSFWLSNIHP